MTVVYVIIFALFRVDPKFVSFWIRFFFQLVLDVLTKSRLTTKEYKEYVSELPHIDVSSSNQSLCFKPNTELEIVNKKDASRNGMIGE